MFDRLKAPFIVCLALLFVAWIGMRMVNYFTYSSSPNFNLNGLEHNGSYARTVECAVCADNGYKIANVAVKLDDKEIVNNWIKSKQFELPFTIDTTTLADGQHVLDIEATDASYHQNKTQKKYTFVIDNTPLRASFLENEYTVAQGKTLHMRIQANKQLAKAEIKLFGSVHQFYPESEDSTLYECFIPVDCEERPSEYMVTADVYDAVKNKVTLNNKIHVRSFEFKKQRGFAVGEEKMSQEKEMSMSAKMLDEALAKWLGDSPHKKLWSGPFEYPIEVQRVSTPFGEIRMTPERGRYMHRGIDLLNRPKCVVWAAQDGKIIIKDRFLLTGNTVVLDHGMGVFTLYGHLDDFADIEVGESIKKGNPVGKLGMTGYATGYHLHWELRVNNVPVDPTEWTNKVY